MHLLIDIRKKPFFLNTMSVFLIASSLFLSACSVEQKPSSATLDSTGENQELDDTLEQRNSKVLPPPGPYGQQVIKDSSTKKPPMSRAQLFSGVLESHNKVRAKHRLQPLRWSDKLARYSQEWASHLGSGSKCTMRHRSGQPPYGENLYWSSAIVWSNGKREKNKVTIKDVVKAWTDEERWYDYRSNRCQPGQLCGHYTQVVWKNTTEVGCALKVCNDKSQTWVCSYNPPGNFTGMRPY